MRHPICIFYQCPLLGYVQEHILNPLGMTNTDFTYSNEFMEANAAGAAVPVAEAEALVPLMDEARGLGDGAATLPYRG